MVKETSKKSPAQAIPPSAHPYSASDPIPVPEAVESDSDTAWDMWEDSIMPDNAADTDFHPTVPSDLLPHPSAKRPKQDS
jgi:hypothetical protein